MIATGLVITSVLGFTQPAHAYTANEKFVIKLHQDFLYRDPSSNELTWWTTVLNSGTRLQVAQGVLQLPEFEALVMAGLYERYIGAWDQEATESLETSLNSTHDVVTLEVAILSSPAYFSLAGSTNTGLVTKVYQDVLLRSPDPSGLSYWVGRLNAGTSTPASFAASTIRTTEAATRRVNGTAGATSCAQTVLTPDSGFESGSYCIVLDRLADPSGLSHWVGQMSGSGQMVALWSSLAASNEYYNNAQ